MVAHADLVGLPAPVKWHVGAPAKDPKNQPPLDGNVLQTYWPEGPLTHLALVGCCESDVKAKLAAVKDAGRASTSDQDAHLRYAHSLGVGAEHLLATKGKKLASPVLEFIGAGPLPLLVDSLFPHVGQLAVCSDMSNRLKRLLVPFSMRL